MGDRTDDDVEDDEDSDDNDVKDDVDDVTLSSSAGAAGESQDLSIQILGIFVDIVSQSQTRTLGKWREQ